MDALPEILGYTFLVERFDDVVSTQLHSMHDQLCSMYKTASVPTSDLQLILTLMYTAYSGCSAHELPAGKSLHTGYL
jgi:hypothetical protein